MQTTRLTYGHTRVAGHLSLACQAIINNLPPLLFLTFQRQFGLSLGQVTVLISLNFLVQLCTDIAFTFLADKLGYRLSIVFAHACCFAGLVGLAVFPFILPAPYAGLILATVINAVGGGLIEVIASPLVEALPGEGKTASMALLHSFYCWGFVATVLLSTLFFAFVGIAHWRWLMLLWALVPLANGLLLIRVPIKPLVAENAEHTPLRQLFRSRTFIVLFVLMLCAGASEQAMSQWASLFAEAGLQVSKTVGDLLGPCLFAVLMGTARMLYAKPAKRFGLEKVLLFSGLLCIASYLITVFSPFPLLSLAGCAICGFSVAVFWPGTLTLTSKRHPTGGTPMFAVLALAGDVGCSAGPGVVGSVSSLVQDHAGGFALGLFGSGAQFALKMGILAAILFPTVLVLGLLYLRRRHAGKSVV